MNERIVRRFTPINYYRSLLPQQDLRTLNSRCDQFKCLENMLELESQGMMEKLAKIVRPDWKEEIDFASNVASLGKYIKDTMCTFFELVKKYVQRTYTSIKESLQQWAATIKIMLEAFIESVKKGTLTITEIFSAFKAAGVPETPDMANINAKIILEVDHSKGDVFSAQGGNSVLADIVEKAPLPLMTSIVTALMWLGSDKFGASSMIADKFMKTVSAATNISRLDPGSICKKIVNFIYYAFTGKDYFVDYELNRDFSRITRELTHDLAELETLYNPPMEIQQNITKNYLQLERIYPLLLNEDPKASATNSRIYTYLRDKCNPWVSNMKGSKRIKPVVLVMSGPSGTGKTWTQKMIIEDVPKVLHELINVQGVRDDLPIYAAHARRPTSLSVSCMGEKNEFNDGYMDPLFYCFEEYQTSTIQEVKTDWSNHFMQCVDDQPYMLNMAFEKGKKFFSSPFVIATGNFDKHHKQVHDPTAYHRRIEMDFKVIRMNELEGTSFDPMKDCRYIPTREMKETLLGDKTPSKILSEMFKALGDKAEQGFIYTDIVYMMALVYMERIAVFSLPANRPEMALEAIHARVLSKGYRPKDGASVFWMSQRHLVEKPREGILLKKLNKLKKKVEEDAIVISDTMVDAYAQVQDACISIIDALKDKVSNVKFDLTIPFHKTFAISIYCYLYTMIFTDDEWNILPYDADSDIYYGMAKAFVKGDECKEFCDLHKVSEEHILNKCIHEMKFLHKELVKIIDETPQVSDIQSKIYLGLLSGCNLGALQEFQEFILESQGKDPLHYKMPVVQLDAQLSKLRADSIYEMCYGLLSLTDPHRSKVVFMSGTRSGLLELLDYKSFSNQVKAIGWYPEEDPSMDKAGNPWFHFCAFDRYALQSRNVLKSLLLIKSSRKMLTKSEWSGLKKNFCRMYYHWYRAHENIVSKPRLMGSEILSDLYLKEMIPFMSEVQYKAIVRDFHREFQQHITRRGVVCGLPKETVKSYKRRLYENKIRNDTQPRKTHSVPEGPYVTHTHLKKKENAQGRKGAVARNNARQCKFESQMFSPKSKVDRYPKSTFDFDKYASSFAKHRVKVLDEQGVWVTLCYDKMRQEIDAMKAWDTMTLFNFCAHVRTFQGFVGLTEMASYDLINKYVMCYAFPDKTTCLRILQEYGNAFRQCIDSDHMLRFVKHFSIATKTLSYDPPSYRTGIVECYASSLTDDNPLRSYIFPCASVHNLINVTQRKTLAPLPTEIDQIKYYASVISRLYLFDVETDVFDYYMHKEQTVNWDSTLVGQVVGVMCLLLASTLGAVISYYVMSYVIKSAVAASMRVFEKQSKVDEENVSQSFDYNPKPDNTPHVNVEKILMEKQTFKAQMGSNTTAVAKVSRNMYSVLVDGFSTAQVLFYEGGNCIMNSHVYAGLPRYFDLVPFVPVTDVSIYKIDKNTTVVLGDSCDGDKIFINIPKMRQHADIVSHFVKKSDADEIRVLMSGMVNSFLPQTVSYSSDIVENIRHCYERTSIKNPTRPYSLYDYYYYNWTEAKKGSCGSVLFGCVDSVGKIIGIHTAGNVNAKVGVATSVTYEDVYPYYTKNHTSSRCVKLDKLNHFDTFSFIEETDTYKLVIDDLHSQGQFMTVINTQATSATTFRPTEFQQFKFRGGSPKIPAVLTFEAYQKALEKEKGIDPSNYAFIADKLVEQHKEDIFDKLYGGMQIPMCRTLTFDEALGSYENLAPFDKSTSKGLRLKNWGLSKRDILEGGPDREKYAEKHELRWAAMERGEFEYQLNTDMLKDELRDPERVELKKTRIFKITDFDDNVVLKRCLGDLVSKTKDAHWVTPYAPGVDPCGSEWRIIADYFGDSEIVSSDIKGFESTVSAFVTRFLYFLFGKLFRRKLDFLFACYAIASILHAIRFNRRMGRLRGNQNTSGNWLTTWLNSICNQLYFSVIALFGAYQYGEVSPAQVLKDLRIKIYSDDNLTSLNRDWWTPEYLKEQFMSIFHIEMTAVDKGNNICATRISGANFLSRGFRIQEGQVFAPLAFDSLIAQIYFVRVPKKNRGDTAFIHKQLQQNLDNVVRELYEYSVVEADLLASEIIEFIFDNKLPLNFDYDFNMDRVHRKMMMQ